VGAALAGEEEGALMAKLVLYLPDGSLHDILLDKERLTIGRRADNDVCLPFPAVSGEHAAVVTILADSFLEDLNSTNGTLVNGKAVVKHFLRDNDLIDIGRQRLMYFSHDGAAAEPLPPDVLRREIRGLHDQVERASEARGAGPEASPPPVAAADPLFPDEDLLADFDVGVLPGEAKVAPPPPGPAPHASASPTPSSSSRQGSTGSTVASRLASTWSPDAPEAKAPPPRQALPRDDPPPTPRKRTTVRTKVVDPRNAPDPVPADLPIGYHVRVLSGPNEGRELVLDRPEMAVGRVGTQVARLAGNADGWRIVRVEGADPVEVNGTPVPADGVMLAAGDHFRVAETDLVFEPR
jgi:hypothetical protein